MTDHATVHHLAGGPRRTFYDAETGGPLQLELGRIGDRRYRLRRQFGYLDDAYDVPFICPDDVATYETDLASIPWFFSWIVPTRGRHLPAIMLHDALVVDRGRPPTHLGPPVTREEADRVMRDAMGDSGVGFIRRWLAWTGAFLATAWAAMEPRWWWRALVVVTFATIAVLGIAATIDLFDLAEPLPWMADRDWVAEIRNGAIVAVLVPLGLSVLWGRRWRAAAIGGVTLAFVLHITLAMIVVWAGYVVAEAVATRLGKRRPPGEVVADQEALVLDRQVTDQVGKASATFVDLHLPREALRMTVTGPGMLVSGLRLVTDLGVLEGHCHPALVELAGGLRTVAHCGLTGPTETRVTVAVDRQGPALVIDVGPASMYESVLEIATRDGGTLEQLLDRTIASGTGRGYVAGLVPIAARAHVEHHPAAPPHDPATEVGDATGEEVAGGHP